jgi:hypothetical protein
VNQITYDHLFPYPIILRDSSLFIGGDPSDSLTKSNIVVMKLDQKFGTGVNDDYQFLNSYELSQNYPNPFNPSTNIQYAISSRQLISLKVYDILGNEIATLVNEEKSAGQYEVEFDGTGLPSGIYFYQIKADSFIETKKMILLK